MKLSPKLTIPDDMMLTAEEIVQKLLESRGITDRETFITPKAATDISLHDFGFEEETERTISLLTKIKEANQSVVVYTDYDADGITGGAILWETLHLLGFSVMPYVPHRKLEGYGFSQIGIDVVQEKFHPALIMSVDHGISAREKIAYAKSIGISVIVTDHHIAPELIPDQAEAIFHIPALSGSGVSYFVSKMIFEQFGKPSDKNYKKLKHNFEHDYLALASIGTIADLVPLIGPSRSVAKYGLAAFSNLERPGLKEIMELGGIVGRVMTPYEIGFVIAPRINAVGRLQHAIDALRLLCTTNKEKAFALAHQIGEQNTRRQDLVKDAVKEAKQMVEERKMAGELPKIIILASDHWHEGIMGLIASKLVEEYSRPVIIMTKNDGHYKASARSISNFHITDFLRSMQKEYLVDAGGHKQAAGFTILSEKVPEFIKASEEKVNSMLSDADLIKVIETDMHLSLSLITAPLLKTIETFQPFGMGNPQPSFSSEVVVIGAQVFGKKSEHLRIFVKDLKKTLKESF